ncbi:uncharacterized protein RSE6_08426 [Rhynchosporium secalis]|uniref:Uncharacterized protein n=1 Tax=Rhynchosporium secalis TaxID=38038 RepID=A0A1E1MFL4_RHYSE|nr:uncharacterized protein RSE6_08426 [Rhynchosporium secalis]
MPRPRKSHYPPLQVVSKETKGDDDDGGGDKVGKDYGGKGDEENPHGDDMGLQGDHETIILKATMISGCDRTRISIAQDDWSRKKREDNDQERIDKSEEVQHQPPSQHLTPTTRSNNSSQYCREGGRKVEKRRGSADVQSGGGECLGLLGSETEEEGEGCEMGKVKRCGCRQDMVGLLGSDHCPMLSCVGV